jgi:hypothetical protein
VGDERGPVRAILTVVTVAPAVGLAAAGELWDWARPWISAAGVRALMWLREDGRDG